MKTLKRFVLTVVSASLCASFACAASIPNTDNPTSALGPTLRTSFTGLLTDTSGYSFAGEVSPYQYRLSATYGWNFFVSHQFKFTGEFVQQRINYAYFAGDEHHYETQGAFGGNYMFDIYRASIYRPQFDLSAYYSYSGADSLDMTSGTFINTSGLPQNFMVMQRASGSIATGVSPGVSARFWRGNRTGIALNYDDVRYTLKYQPSYNVSGAGATLQISQLFTESFGIDAKLGVRKPFNYYQANIGWDKLPHYPNWALKLNGAYVAGKSGLPSTYNLMLAADYFLDRDCDATELDRSRNELLGWIAKPAVYMPQVLGVADQRTVIG
jgi:hypothetical protein